MSGILVLTTVDSRVIVPEFDLDAALAVQVPWIVGDRHLSTEETELVQAVMRALMDRFGAQITSCHVWMVNAGVRVNIAYGGVDYRAYGGIDKLLDDMTEAVYNCQQRDRQIRNLTTNAVYTAFYLYR